MKGISVVGCGDNLRDYLIGTSRTAGGITDASVICTSLTKNRELNGVGNVLSFIGIYSLLRIQNNSTIILGMKDVGKLTDRNKELAKILR